VDGTIIQSISWVVVVVVVLSLSLSLSLMQSRMASYGY
jgi:hypothetical protein